MADVTIPKTVEDSPSRTYQVYTIREGLIQEVSLTLANVETVFYALPALLTAYGPPGEVWVYTYGQEREGLPFSVTLVYPEHNFIINYRLQAELQDGKVRACFPLGKIVYLDIWPPDQEVTFTGLVGESHAISDVLQRPLEEATNMSIDEFYDAFTDPSSTTCLETPIDLWPAPGE